jgi:hypothetical protein
MFQNRLRCVRRLEGVHGAQLTDSRILGAPHPAVGVPRGVAEDTRFSFTNTAGGQASASKYLADEIRASETVSTGSSARRSGSCYPSARRF